MIHYLEDVFDIRRQADVVHQDEAVRAVAVKKAGIHFAVVDNGSRQEGEVVACSRDAVTFAGWNLLLVEVALGVGSEVQKRWEYVDQYSFGAS